MKRLMALLLGFMILFVLSSCGGGSGKTTIEGSNIEAPSWYLNVPQDPNFIMAVATATSPDLQLAIDKAKNLARADIAQQLEVKIQAMEKNFREQVAAGDDATLLEQFTSVNKTVVSNVLRGVKVKQQEVKKEGNQFRAYVLMEMPFGAAAEELLNQMKKQQEMYTRFRATQAFQELEKEVEKYEEYKQKQGGF